MVSRIAPTVVSASLVLLAIGFGSVAWGQGEPGKRIPDQVVTYKQVEGDDLVIDVFLPSADAGEKQTQDATGKRTAIVLFFGGGWNGGDTKHFRNQAIHFASRGMVAFCPQYRTKKSHQAIPKTCVTDGKSAMRWVRDHADEYNVDPDRIAAGGGSAGGHVAAATATITAFDDPKDDTSVDCRPNALVLFNPVYDNGPKGYGHDRVETYWKEFSPMHNLSAETPPTIVFLGTKDKLIPVSTAKEFQRRMQSLGVRSDLHLYQDAAHGFFNRGESYDDTLAKADAFLVSLGYLKKPR